jgi:hypothetical protein
MVFSQMRLFQKKIRITPCFFVTTNRPDQNKIVDGATTNNTTPNLLTRPLEPKPAATHPSVTTLYPLRGYVLLKETLREDNVIFLIINGIN